MNVRLPTAKAHNTNPGDLQGGSRPIRILHVERDQAERARVRQALEKEFDGLTLTEATSAVGCQASLADGRWDVVLCGSNCDNAEGTALLSAVQARAPSPPLVVIVGPGCETAAAEMLKRGAADALVRTSGYVQLVPWVVRRVLGLEAMRESLLEGRRCREQMERLVAQHRARVDELERQRAEMDQLAATGRLAARIAHEINNPLAGIKNSFLLVKDGIPSSHQYYEYVEMIEKEIERIARIVHQMYDLYRPDQGLLRKFCLKPLVENVVALLTPSSGPRRVRIVVEPFDPAIHVLIPEGYLSQVLLNLVKNAIEASAEDGVVTLRVTRMDADLCVLVADRGCGIPAELGSRIFEPFFTTKKGFAGGSLGLGLSVSRSLVESMNGKLEYESKVGEGTTFRIRLRSA